MVESAQLNHFIIHELIHLTFGLILFLGLLKLIKHTKLALWALFISLFMDIDHLFDYFLALGFTFNFEAIVNGIYFDINDRLFVLLHSWEATVILIILGWVKRRKKLGKFLLATGLGMFTHLTVDQLWYNPHQWEAYFILARIAHGFASPSLW